MRIACLLVLLFASAVCAAPQLKNHTVVNYGLPQASGQKPMAEMPPQPASAADLRADAAQFAHLTQTVQPQLENASHGVLHKDLLANLKAVEKLAKHLEQQLRHGK